MSLICTFSDYRRVVFFLDAGRKLVFDLFSFQRNGVISVSVISDPSQHVG